MVLPFVLLLAMIALGPLCFPTWWEKKYPAVALGLAMVTLGYYLIPLHAFGAVKHAAREYLSFIALIGSLFVVSGGIHLNTKGGGTPLANTLFLLAGALLANVLGTTGASMLLIRPWLRMNRAHVAAHHLVFFIFIVSNVGGCLTPIADAPLFLGFLKGVPFWWVAEQCLGIWALGVGFLLAAFFVVDSVHYRRLPHDRSTSPDSWRLEGSNNLGFLAVIIGAVFVERPPFLREGLMIVAALGSWFTTRRSVHEANQFNFHPLQEVAILFIGIFATMMPALDWLQANASRLTLASPALFYCAAGSLSSLLDNAPTYVCFLKTIFGRFVDADVVIQVQHLVQSRGADLAAVTGAHAEEIRNTWLALQKYHAAGLAAGNLGADEIRVACLIGNPGLSRYLAAISVGSVFFGACTYMGNSPNFMVKSIAQKQRVPTPSFPAYVIRFTLPFLAPLLALVAWVFFLH